MNQATLLASAFALMAVGILLLAVGLLLRSRHERRAEDVLQATLSARTNPAPGQDVDRNADPPGLSVQWLQWLESIGNRFNGGRLQAALLTSEDRLLLDRVGWNTRTGAAVFLGLRLVLAPLSVLLAAVAFRPQGSVGFLILVAALAAGLLAPKLALNAWSSRLRKAADDELPLLIDLLRLLQGVGFSIDQSLQMLGEKLHIALPVLGRELHDANLAYVRGRTRAQSLNRIAESYDNDDLRSLVQLILQVHQHGGAVQEPLHQFGNRLREKRRMELKEKTGKLSVKMTVVMMLTLLPALMLVLAGPAIVALTGLMRGMGN